MWVSIGGMEIDGWRHFFRTIRLTMTTLRAARAEQDCLHADIYRVGRRYFALSVWETRSAMQAFARGPAHGPLMAEAPRLMRAFRNHSYESDAIPTRDAARAAWEASGR